MTIYEFIKEWNEATSSKDNYFMFEINGEMVKAWCVSPEMSNKETIVDNETITIECKFVYDSTGN